MSVNYTERCTIFESTTALQLAERDSALAGTANGGLFALQCPDLQNYSHARAHKQPTLDVVATGEGIASASADWIRFHDTGSVPKVTIPAAQVADLTCTFLICLWCTRKHYYFCCSAVHLCCLAGLVLLEVRSITIRCMSMPVISSRAYGT